MKFGENLYNLRKVSKMSQENLAEKVGVSRQSVSKWENGDSYPEMDNIMKLCNIFNCKINDLVHEDMSDIDSLDEDIKVKVVKLNQKQQKKMKGLSKALYVIARIGKIVVTIPIPITILIALIAPIFMNNINVEDDIITFGKFSSDKVKVEKIDDDRYIINVNGSVIDQKEERETWIKIKTTLDNNSITMITVYVVAGFACLSASLILLRMILKYLEKLFIEIHNGDTPFTLENIKNIKKMAFSMIAIIIVNNFVGGIFNLLIGNDVDMGFNLIDLVQILFLFSMAYIFQYGYELQKDSNGKIYGEKEEEEVNE